MRSPGGNGELDVVWGEESDTVVVTDVPASFHDVGESVGSSSNLLEVVTPTRVVVNEPRGGLRTNRPIWVVEVEEKLGNSHVGGNVWDGAIGGDEFLDDFLRHNDYGGG